jgi:hypothetical protein
MFKQITNLDGSEIYLISSLLLFMVFFVVVGIYLFKISKSHVQMMSNLPIDDYNNAEYEEN